MSGWKNEWIELVNWLVNEWMNGRVKKLMHEQMNELINQLLKECIKKWQTEMTEGNDRKKWQMSEWLAEQLLNEWMIVPRLND